MLQLIAEGLGNKQIADHLDISVNTVKYYTSSPYSRMDVGNRAEAMHQGIRLGKVVVLPRESQLETTTKGAPLLALTPELSVTSSAVRGQLAQLRLGPGPVTIFGELHQDFRLFVERLCRRLESIRRSTLEREPRTLDGAHFGIRLIECYRQKSYRTREGCRAGKHRLAGRKKNRRKRNL